MSYMPNHDPECGKNVADTIAVTIDGRQRELGDGMSVRRLLPSIARRMVGPFTFVDHMGPAHFEPGHGLDVRPHPHINLATVTFLFDGEILHRDSVGSEQVILPGAVNWMTAGRGIVHSERTPGATRKTARLLHGMQLWVALPKSEEETEPSFQHHPASTIPVVEHGGARLRVIAGSAYGETSPVKVLSPLFYVEAQLERGSELVLPDEYADRAAYVVSGALDIDGNAHGTNRMVVFERGAPARVRALEPTRVLLLGGAPLDGERYIWWNFVSSSKERLERAKQDWREGRFPKVPGDETELIPLPDMR
jgi:redox-sensitive bicupin YhaK (pirin superfamily)